MPSAVGPFVAARPQRVLLLTGLLLALALLLPHVAGAAPSCKPEDSPVRVANDDVAYVGGDCTAPAAVRVTGRPAHGHVEVFVDSGGADYVPAAGYVGPDSLTYVHSDATGDATPVTVAFDVRPAGSGPQIYPCFTPDDDSLYTRVGGTRRDTLTCSTDAAPTVSVTPPGKGTVRVSAPTSFTGEGDEPAWRTTIDYQNTAGAVGDNDKATLTVTAGGTTYTGELKWFLEGANDNEAPDCDASLDATATVEVTSTTSLSVRCTDHENDPLTFSPVGFGAFSGGGIFGYISFAAPPTPTAGPLTIVASDGRDASTPLTLPVTVVGPQPTPVCAPVGAQTAPGADVSVTLSCPGATEVYVLRLSRTARASAEHGSFDVSGRGASLTLTYHPDPGFVGIETMRFGGGTVFHSSAVQTATFAVGVPLPGGQPGGAGGVLGVAQTQAQAEAKAKAKAAAKAKVLPKVLKAVGAALAKGRDAKLGPYDLAVRISATVTVPAHKTKAKAAARPVKLAGGKLRLAAGKRGRLKVRLSKAGRRRLAHVRKLRATTRITVVATATGAKVSATRKVTLRRRS